jgi:hypothetical protein
MTSTSTAFCLPCPGLCGPTAEFAGHCLNFRDGACLQSVTPDDARCIRRQVEADLAAASPGDSHWLDDSTADNYT